MDVFSKECKATLLGLVVLWSAGVSLPAMAVEEIEDEIVVTPRSPFVSSYQGINYDGQNPGDHVTGPSGENATFSSGNNGGEALEECSSERINVVHQHCVKVARKEFNGDGCGGPNVIFGVEGTIDMGIAELDVSISIDNNQDCADDNMALDAEISECNVDKAEKEDECANGG